MVTMEINKFQLEVRLFLSEVLFLVTVGCTHQQDRANRVYEMIDFHLSSYLRNGGLII